MKTIDKQSGIKSFSIKPTVCALALAGAMAVPHLAWAQAAPVFFEVEGPVTAVSSVLADGSVDITMFGRPFKVPVGAAISTPSATLNMEQLARRTALPGRTALGFENGTGILIGEVVIDANGVPQAIISSVAIEPGETVLIGAISSNQNGVLRLMDVPLVELPADDDRMPSEGIFNDFGFLADPATIQPGMAAASEGYYGDDGSFHHYILSVTGAGLADTASSQSVISRARCVAGGRLEVQGATYLPASVTVEFFNAITGERFGQITPTLEPGTPFGVYRFRADVNEGAPNSPGACPSEVRATTVHATNSTTAIAGVDGVVVAAEPPVENVAPVAVNDTAAMFTNLATPIDILGNDNDANGNMDPTQVVFSNVSPALTLQNQGNGDVLVTATAAGTHTFDYTVADTGGLISNVATVTITAEDVITDVVDITRANFRADRTRWEVRGTINQPGQVITVTLVRTGQQIGAPVTADATGAWFIDVRNTGIVAQAGDMVRATSNGGGFADFAVTLR